MFLNFTLLLLILPILVCVYLIVVLTEHLCEWTVKIFYTLKRKKKWSICFLLTRRLLLFSCLVVFSLNNSLFAHSSESCKSKILMSEGLVSSEASLFGIQMILFSLCPHMVFPHVCLCPNFLL